MNRIALIQRLFGNRPHDCAMDAAKWNEDDHPRKGGKFAKKGDGASSPAPKKESKPKKAKAEGSATTAKPRPKANVSEQAHAAAKAKVAENAAKPKKPAKAKGEKPAPKEKAQPKPKKPTQEERVAKLGEQYTNAMGAKPSRRRDGAESPVAAPAAEKTPHTEPSKIPKDESGWKSHLNGRIKEVDAALTKLTLGEMSKEDGEKLLALVKADHKNSLQANKDGVIETYTPHGRPISGSFDILEGRLESAINARGSGPGLASILKSMKENMAKAAPAVETPSPAPEAKPKPAPKKATSEVKAPKPKSEASATKAAPKPKAPKKSTVAPSLGEAFKAKPGRRRGGANPDHAS